MQGFPSHGASLIEIWLHASEDEAMNNRITINPQVCHGQACIQGTRISVYQILRILACGDSVEDILQKYPSITREDILACFDYVASLAEEQVTPLEALVDRR